jgi:hypothetical protein
MKSSKLEIGVENAGISRKLNREHSHAGAKEVKKRGWMDAGKAAVTESLI